MKKIFVLLSFFATTFAVAQAPEAINYQGIARDAGSNIIITTIGLKFEIHSGSASGPVIYDETHTVIPSAAGIFTAAIGSGVAGVGTFSTISWGTNNYFLTVNMDPAGGTSYSTIGTSQLLSVPYALYAKTSGNASTTYSAGNAISISSGSIINTAPDKAVTLTGIGSTTIGGVYPNFTITTPFTSTAAVTPNTVSINPPHVVTNLGPNNNSITIQPTQLTATTGIASIGGAYPNYNVFVPPPVLTVNGNTLTITQGSATTTQTFSSGGAWYKPSASAVSLTSPNDNVGIGTTTPGNRLYVLESINPAIAVVAKNNYTTTSNPNAMGLWGESNNPNGTSAGVYGVHNGGGNGVSGISTTNTFSNTAGVYGYAMGTSSTNVSVQADVANGNSIGVFVNSFPAHTGTGLYSLKAGSSGNSARVEISNTANSADALFVTTNGLGASVHAVNGPTVAGSSNTAVWLESGHLKSTQSTAPTSNTVSVSGGGIQGVSITLGGGSTDVKGIMNAVITTTSLVNNGNNCVLKVNFNKSYINPPVVVVTPITDLFGLSYFVSNVTLSSFNLTIRNSSGTNLSTPGSLTANFNYMVIE